MSTTLQPTMRMGGRLFWAYVWRVLLINFLAGIAVGLMAAGLQYVFPPLVPLLQIVLYIGAFIVTIFVFSIIFDKRYKHYTVKLVDNVTGEAMPRHWKHGLRPWWSYTWRCTLIGIVLTVPGVLVLTSVMGPEFKRAQLQSECQQLVAYYQQAEAANDTATMQAAQSAFEAQQCRAAFAPMSEEQQAALKAKARGAQLGILLGVLLGIAIQFKLFQIVLRKRYEKFHVQVTANEGAVA